MKRNLRHPQRRTGVCLRRFFHVFPLSLYVFLYVFVPRKWFKGQTRSPEREVRELSPCLRRRTRRSFTMRAFDRMNAKQNGMVKARPFCALCPDRVRFFLPTPFDAPRPLAWQPCQSHPAACRSKPTAANLRGKHRHLRKWPRTVHSHLDNRKRTQVC